MHVRQRLGASERHACRVLGQPRTTQRRVRKGRADEAALRTDVVRLASRFGRYGYRQITNMLRIEGWQVNHKRVERIWRQEGLKVPRRQPKRGRLWLNDGSCIRLRPLHKNHVWSYDFVSTRTHDGRALKLLTVLDEHTRQCLAIKVARRTRAHDVIEVLTDLFVRHGPPEHLRSDNGPEGWRRATRLAHYRPPPPRATGSPPPETNQGRPADADRPVQLRFYWVAVSTKTPPIYSTHRVAHQHRDGDQDQDDTHGGANQPSPVAQLQFLSREPHVQLPCFTGGSMPHTS